MECLAFRPAERAVTDPVDPEVVGTWMYCGESPHDIAFIKGPNGKLHHFAFHLGDWNDILKAGDIFSMDDVPIDIGPTRHGITRGMTIYFFDPSGNRNEVFAGGYRTGPDFPTITWTEDQLGKGLDYRGIHHFGVLVDDVEEFSKKLESLGAEHYVDRAQMEQQAGYFEKKFYGPERVLFDIAEHGWAGAEPLPAPVKEAAD